MFWRASVGAPSSTRMTIHSLVPTPGPPRLAGRESSARTRSLNPRERGQRVVRSATA